MKISIRKKQIIDRPARHVLAYIQNLANIGDYEPKLSHVTLQTESMTYDAKGQFMGLGWQGRFAYELRPNGFHSWMIDGPLDHMQGGFAVRALDGSHSQLMHYEEYDLPWWLFVCVPVVKLYLNFSLQKELNTIKEKLCSH
ncbi:MAG: SRPBCC family protein [Coxiellaceae bacterium]|nr:SRPBCC family protein [Coxiellaceae bacterium]